LYHSDLFINLKMGNAVLLAGIYLHGGEGPKYLGGTMLILLVILLVLALGAFPSWPYSRSWGYYPSGGLGLILLIVLIVALFNHGL
jgi:asparagine N-glycosylation enzyme membrane subunit Stt3